MRRSAVLAGLLLVSLVALGLVRANAAEPGLMDGWYVYDYRAGLDVEPAVNVFHAAVEVDGSVWANHRQWSIDDPESPPSVLALVRYEQWDLSSGDVSTGRAATDLRGDCVQFDLAGKDLDLNGAELSFWVMTDEWGQRWHATIPLEVGEGWTTNRLELDEVGWRQSWSRHGHKSLEATLATAVSYGVGMVGFDQEPSGMLGMRDFRFC